MKSLAQAQATRPFSELVDAAGRFVETYKLFLSLDTESRQEIVDLISQLDSEHLDAQERESAYATIAQVIFPDAWTNDPSLDTTDPQAVEDLDREEAAFTSRVLTLMAERGMTQAELAAAIGVDQPAISLLLSHQARPQQRTVARIARALGVAEAEIWPDEANEEHEVRTRSVDPATVSSALTAQGAES